MVRASRRWAGFLLTLHPVGPLLVFAEASRRHRNDWEKLKRAGAVVNISKCTQHLCLFIVRSNNDYANTTIDTLSVCKYYNFPFPGLEFRSILNV